MTRHALLGLVAVTAIAVVAVTRGAEDPYTIKLRLADAGGLKSGSQVTVGGVPIGTVGLDLRRDHVDVRLELKSEHAPIGRDATAAVVAQNVLGQKQVSLTLGDRTRPAPDGYVLPASRVSPTTDLDQLLATLDPDTRTRLAIVLNETGEALTGRKLDLRTALRDFPPAMRAGTALIEQLGNDNRSLGNLVRASDRYVATLAAGRRNLGEALERVAGTTETIAARREALRQTLRRGPGALRSARGFLAELRATTRPLGTTARLLQTTAPPLRAALDRLPAFERAASPALAVAADTAPDLDRLGRRAAPVLRRAVPVLDDVGALTNDVVPRIGRTLDGSMDNVLAILENWSRAIQFSDGLSHIFRGEASFAPDLIQSAVKRAMRGTANRRSRPPAKRSAPETQPAPVPENRRPPKPLPRVPLVDRTLDSVRKSLIDPIVPSLLPPTKRGSDQADQVEILLDYFLKDG